MKENLEKYLKKNRQNLDVDTPNEEMLWKEISLGIKNKKTGLPNWFWKAAAILLFVVSTTYVFYNETKDKKESQLILAHVSPELQKQEIEFIQVANNKWDQINASLPEHKTQLKFLFEELDGLEEVYESYQMDLNEIGANEFIIRAMLDYHSKKIRILDKILHEIEKNKRYESNKFTNL